MIVQIPEERMKFMKEHIREWKQKPTYTLKELSSLIGLLLYLGQIVIALKSTAAWLMQKKNTMNRSTTDHAKSSKRLLQSLDRVDYILSKWNGVANIYEMRWSKGPDITIFCDAAIDLPFPKAGSFGKGAFVLPAGKWVSSPWTEEEAEEGRRELSTSSTHLELTNMLESVLFFASEKQKILCVSDNDAAVQIANNRYSKTANKKLIERIQEFDVACLQRSLSVRFEWRSREEAHMKVADSLSRNQVNSAAQPLF